MLYPIENILCYPYLPHWRFPDFVERGDVVGRIRTLREEIKVTPTAENLATRERGISLTTGTEKRT